MVLAQHLNERVQVLPKYRAVLSLPVGKPKPIVSSMTGFKFFWGLSQCIAGKQHYRLCTPHALKCDVCVRCPFCAYDAGVWVAARKNEIWGSELRLMAMLIAIKRDQEVCWQVKLGFWAAPVDFKFMHLAVVLQADGSCHFQQMYQESTGQRLYDDLKFCVAAVEAGISVIRVHVADINRRAYPNYLPPAIEAAAAAVRIVLSSGYSTVYIFENGQLLTYAQVLANMLPGSNVMTDAYNNTIISKT